MTQSADKVALVTAASAGIGEACARELASRGYRVSLLARSEAVESLAAELGGLGTRGSVADAGDVSRYVAATLERFGRIDAVVNNSGHPAKGDLLALTDEQWIEGFELLFLSVVRVMRLVVPAMLKQGGGSVVNVTSFATYSASVSGSSSATRNESMF